MNKLLLYLALSLVTAGASISRSYVAQPTLPSSPAVLGERDVAPPPLVFSVNVPAIFSRDITAPNVVYSLVPGEGISVSSGQTPTITNTGVTSLQGETGELELVEGSGISLDGLKITNTGILALSAGSGISVSGSTITNSDLGSSQSIFKTVSVSGQSDVAADSNSDTLTLVAGSGLTITTSASGDSVTITPNDPSIAAGWTHTSGLVALTTSSDSVSIGGGLNVNSSGITNAGSITGASGFTSSGTITLADLSTGIVHSNVYGVLSSSAVALGGSDVSGTLGPTNGGTGLSSYTTGDLIYASATNVLSKLGAGGNGEVLTMSGGVPDWATISSGDPCPTCLVNNPGSDQTITPTAGTGLIIKKASSGTSDIFKVTSADGATAYLKVESDGDVLLGNGQTTQGVFTVSPTGTHPMTLSPSSYSVSAYTGTLTTSDLTAARTWTFPDASGIVCTTSGNCSGSSSALGGSGTANYLSKWSDTYSLANSLLYDTGTNVGIGTTSPGYKLDVIGTASVSGNVSAGTNLTVVGSTTIGSTLNVTGAVDLSSTLGVTGATTLSSTLGVTGNATFNGQIGIGTTSPQEFLDIYSTTADSDAQIRTTGFSNRSSLYLQAEDLNNWARIEMGGYGNTLSRTFQISTGSNVHGMIFSTANHQNGQGNGDILFKTAGASQALEITRSGQIGIGTTDPTSLLHTTGKVTGKALAIFDETGDQNILVASASGTTKFILDRTGKVSIGTTAAPTNNLVVGGMSSTPGIKFLTTGFEIGSTAGYSNRIALSGTTMLYNASYNNSISDGHIFQVDYSAEAMRIMGGGPHIGIGTTNPVGMFNVQGKITGKALAIFDETGDQNILVASASGTTRFTIANNGSLSANSTSQNIMSVSGTSQGITLWGTTTNHISLIPGSSDTFSIMDNAWANKIVVTTSGVGIGTDTTPDYFFDVQGLMNVDTSAYLAAVSGQVGIGTTAPTSLLHVSGKVTGKALAIFDETGDQALLTASASGVTKFLVNNSGYVGIGTTSLAEPLNVGFSDSSGAISGLKISNTNTSTSKSYAGMLLSAQNGTVTGDFTAVPTSSTRMSGGGIIFRTTTNHHLGFSTNDTLWMRLSNTGKLYIANPDDTVTHIGNSISTNGHYSGVGIGYNETNGLTYAKSAIVQEQLGDAAARGKIHFLNDGTADNSNANLSDARITIDYNGLIGIGTTDPTSKLHVSGAVTGKALTIFNETGNQALLTASASGVTKFTVGNDGTITTTLGTGTVYSNAGVLTNTDPSDLNLKQNILSLGDGTLGKVLGLRAVSYEWKRDGKGALGFIAQEVQSVFPELVGSNADGTLGLYTTQFIPVLAKAIQEQQLEIDEIKLSSASASISNAEWTEIRDLVAMLQTKVDQIFTTLNNYQDQFVTKQSIQEELCVGTESDMTCLTKQQLDDLLRVASPSATMTPIPTPTPSSSPNLEPSPSASSSSTPI